MKGHLELISIQLWVAASLLAFFGAGATAGAAVLSNASSVPRAFVRDLGEATATTPVSIVVTLNYHHEDQLDRLVELQNDPGSPYFRHWLTSAQFDSAFAPTPAEYERAILALEGGGFHITQTFANRTVIDARGTASAAERLFQTRIHRVEQAGHGVRYTNVLPVTLPAALQTLVYSVNGLNNLSLVHTDFVGVARRRIRPEKATAPYTGPVSTTTGYSGLGPIVYGQSYDFPDRHATKNDAYDGKGRAEAIVIDAVFLTSDIDSYLKYFGIKRSAPISRVSVDGGTTSDPYLTNDSIEATLDTEVIAGGAPGAAVYVYETAPFDWGVAVITDAYNAIVSQNKVDAVNSSFGVCESVDETISKSWDHIATQGASLGITFHAASGDDGAACSASIPTGVSAPASSPHVVAIGGTQLNVKPKTYAYEGEVGWVGSGGGVSTVFAMPAWQKNVSGMLGTTRNVPDLAFDADPLTGFPLYFAGTWNNPWNPLGGTSLASPLFGAALLEVNGVVGARTGLAAQRIYAAFAKTGYELEKLVYFHDITSGSNGIYSAAPGYDRVTGIGSWDAWNVAQVLK
jgi:subtilase family serine protease